MRTHALKIAGLCGLAMLVALCAPQRAWADDDDPPSRVARLGYMHGSVSFQPAGTDDWVGAIVNRPLTTGDKLWADSDSRAELHIGSASIRIASKTGFSFLNLTDNVTQIQVTAGTVRVRVKHLDDNESFEIDTPNLAFSVLRTGTYRVNVSEAGDSTVIKVGRGEGEITGGGSAFTLHPREIGTFQGTDQLTADIEPSENDDDDFDAWCADRDRHEDLSASARYVSPDVIGYQDLDDNGGWRQVPGYGNVWFPHTTIVDWAPYRYGHWAYVAPWGYTWIDDAPWGFAPFHYGRWINYGGVWGWVPAPPPAPNVVYVRPVYAPALVAWVGGAHFGVGVQVGGGAAVNVGWFPLGPREVYVPSYPVSRTYVNNVNVSNTTVNTTVVNNYYNTTIVNRNTTVVNNNTTVVNNNVTVVQQTYVNQRVTGAVTATTGQAFTSAQPVARNVVHVDSREVATAQVNVFTPAVAPAKQAVLGTGVSARAVVAPPAALQSRPVVAKIAPPPPPVTFAKQQQAIQANGGRPLAAAQVRQIQPPTVQTARPEIKIAPPSQPANPQNVQGGRPGQPQNGGANTGNRTFTSGSGAGASAGQPQNGGGGNAGNKPFTPGASGPGASAGQPQNNGANAGSKTSTPGASGPGFSAGQPAANANKPSPPNNNPGQPVTSNKPGNGGNADANPKGFNDRPPSARPTNNQGGNPGNAPNNNAPNNNAAGMNQNHQQQLDQLRVKQDQDRQKLEQQQQADRQRLAQQAADAQRQQQLNQQHQQQVQAQEQKHEAPPQKPQPKQQKDASKSDKDKDKDDHHH